MIENIKGFLILSDNYYVEFKTKMTLNRNNRNLKIVWLYIISIVCIICYFLMENYNVINVLVEKSVEFFHMETSARFSTLIFAGLLQYGLLTVGICIFLMLSFILVREKITGD